MCARSALTLPMLAGVCSGFVRVWVLTSPGQSLLACWGVCVRVRALPLPCQSWLGSAPCVSGYGSRLQPPFLGQVCGVCVWIGFCFHPANPGWDVGMCVLVCALRLYPANPGWGLRCVCLGPGFVFIPKSWLGFVVCVFGLAFCFQPAYPGRVLGCVCLCACSA